MSCVVSTVLLLYTGDNLITALVCIKDTDETISVSGDGRTYIWLVACECIVWSDYSIGTI